MGSIGKNVTIYHPVVLASPENIFIGDGVIISEFVHIIGGIGTYIHEYTHIAPLCSIAGGGITMIGKSVGIAAGVRIVSGMDAFDGVGLIGPCVPKEYRSVYRGETIIEDFSLICSNAVICQDVTIGEGAVVGANSVVMNDIPPWTVAVGSPAKVVRDRKVNKEQIYEVYQKFLDRIKER